MTEPDSIIRIPADVAALAGNIIQNLSEGRLSESALTKEGEVLEARKCDECGSECDRDSVDVGVGVIHGPWGCSCGWSEDDEYNLHKRTPGPDERGGYVDQYGGYHPKGSSMALAYRLADET